MAAEPTAALGAASTPRSSLEDLSEYTDADESVSSAPTEFLAEFLSALMTRDYETALKYCRLILQYEPHNSTAKEFYPLIIQKIQLMREQDSTSSSSASKVCVDDNGNAAAPTSSDGNSSGNSGTSSSSSSSSSGSGDSDSEGTTASYSSLEDDEADDNGNTNRGATTGAASCLPPPTPPPLKAFAAQPPPASSDSESPTEPVSQRLAQLRAQVVQRARP